MTIVSAVPFNLQNGTTADATQVMADFNSIKNDVNTNAAHNGANNDITSLSGLTTPLSPAQGGGQYFKGATSTGSANAQAVATLSPIGFALTAGYMASFIAGYTNTAATTLALSGLTAKNIFKASPAGPVALSGGELVVGNVITVIYDGTEYQLVGAAAAQTGLVLLAFGTVSAAATLDLVLTTYTAYRGIKIILSGFRPVSDGDQLAMRFSTDGGATYAATGYDYALQDIDSDAATAVIDGSGNSVFISIASPGNGTTEGFNGEFTMLNQTASAFWTRVTFQGYYIDATATPRGHYVGGGGAKETAQDTDAVRFLFNSGNIAAGNYAVYGLS